VDICHIPRRRKKGLALYTGLRIPTLSIELISGILRMMKVVHTMLSSLSFICYSRVNMKPNMER
jgi:hypothetical protein